MAGGYVSLSTKGVQSFGIPGVLLTMDEDLQKKREV